MASYVPEENPLVIPLTSTAMETLEWKYGGFQYPNMVRLRTLPDAGALLHAVLNAFFVPYRSNQFNHTSEPIGRKEMVNAYRLLLAERLDSPIDPSNILSPCVYDCLSRGKMKEYAEIIKEYHIDVMRNELQNPDFFLDDKYLELISNELSKDIYVLNALTQDVHMFDHSDVDMYYKGRPAVVLLFLPGHFELVGIQKENGDVVTHFAPTSPFVQALHGRYLELLESSS
jgi:hypothetical protein